MNSMQANEPRSATTGTEGGARLRRLVRRLSRRDATMLPMTLLLIGAASAAHELSGGDAKQKGSSNNEGDRVKAPTDIEAQPGDKVAVLAGKTKIAEHVLTQEDIAAGKVRIAVRAKGKAEVQDNADDAAAAPADATQQAGEETKAEAEDRDDAGAILISDGAGAGSGAAATPAAQQGDDDHSGVFWLFLGLGAVGAGVAIANHGDDGHKAPPSEEPPPPPPPPTQISGEVIKGYLQGAAVYLDTDHDGLPDGDPVYTDSQGRFTFTTDQTGASLLAFGGVDTLTNVPLDGLILRAPGGATVISPLTTLIDELMKQDDSLSVDAAQARLATALGLTLPGGVNLLSFDPIENLQNGGSSVEDQSEAVLNTISAIQSLLVGAGAADAVAAANAAITAMAQSILDGEGALSLSSATDVAQVLEAAFAGTGVGASNAADLSQLAAAIAAVNSSLLEASGLSDAALQATRYALTGFQDLLTSVGAGARNSEQFDRDISFSNDSELAAAIESLATGGVESAIGEHIAASISYAQRLEGDRFVFALNPELKLYQGAPDKIDTVTVKFGDSGVVVERELRGANGAVSIEVISPAADGSYTFQYSELDKISIKPPADFNGVLSADISVHYAGLGVVESDTLGIAITSVNDAPVGQDSTVSTSENLTHVFSLADFPFTDARDGAYASGANELDAVKIVSLPQAGTLYLGETAITTQDIANGFYVSAADIAAGLLRFEPAAGENGAGYASFQFQVRDDGGTANGGVDLDPTARTLTINVASVNDAPTAGDSTVAIDEDTSHTFAPQDFNFTDVDGNSLATLIVTSLPEGGTLWHDGRAITADDLGEHGYSISAADLANGLFRFVPDADANGNVSFEFRVQDDGGTANGGSDTSATATFTFDIAAVSDAPTSAGGGASILEGDAHTFSLTDFDFNDVDGDALATVLIDSLPAGGTLWYDDHQITLDDLGEDGYAVSAEDIALGLLRFVPDTNANGSISFDFRLQDDGGAESSASATFTFEVTSVNDAPVATDSSATVLEDGSHIFSASDFGFSDVEGDGLAAVIITSLPEGGALWYGEDQLTLGDLGEDGYSISAADLAEGMLSFVPDSDSNDSVSFQFRVQDDGGTDNGGVDIGEPATFTINVTPVNDAPVATASSASMLEDGEHTFSAADFGFTD
ncbi:MAG TPA: Ig-like domain-containing protein, partial [Steroidobacter sp.]|nr:Ig-like domain-containing protein [Steroidobacter sp.]